MLEKSTMIKIAAAVLVVAVIFMIMKMKKKSQNRPVIVTAMPMMEPAGYVEDDDFETSQTTLAPIKENFDDWSANDAGDYEEDETEGFTEYSDVNFKSDLLE